MGVWMTKIGFFIFIFIISFLELGFSVVEIVPYSFFFLHLGWRVCLVLEKMQKLRGKKYLDFNALVALSETLL